LPEGGRCIDQVTNARELIGNRTVKKDVLEMNDPVPGPGTVPCGALLRATAAVLNGIA
jgi:hypothetical protein